MAFVFRVDPTAKCYEYHIGYFLACCLVWPCLCIRMFVILLSCVCGASYIGDSFCNTIAITQYHPGPTKTATNFLSSLGQ